MSFMLQHQVILPRVLGSLIVLSVVGCSNLEARKVPLNKRLGGQDGCISGFRYYLSRPYLVVPQKLLVSTTYEHCALAEGIVDGHKMTILVTVDENKQPKYFSGSGEEISPTSVTDLHGLTSTAEQPITPEALPMPPVPGGTGATNVNPPSAAASSVIPSGGATLGLQGQLENAEVAKRSASVLNAFATTAEPDPAHAKPCNCEDEMFQVIYLPDFEEQMAVKSCNFLGKTKFTMIFRDGWQLKTVDGDHDSTPVALELIATLKSLVSAASEVEEKRLAGKMPAGAKASTDDKSKALLDLLQLPFNTPDFKTAIVKKTHYVQPGIYRINKASESSGMGGIGLLSDMGIPLDMEVQVLLKN